MFESPGCDFELLWILVYLEILEEIINKYTDYCC
jgi:hypothetical protein